MTKPLLILLALAGFASAVPSRAKIKEANGGGQSDIRPPTL
jgi:hypothetical protein